MAPASSANRSCENRHSIPVGKPAAKLTPAWCPCFQSQIVGFLVRSFAADLFGIFAHETESDSRSRDAAARPCWHLQQSEFSPPSFSCVRKAALTCVCSHTAKGSHSVVTRSTPRMYGVVHSLAGYRNPQSASSVERHTPSEIYEDRPSLRPKSLGGSIWPRTVFVQPTSEHAVPSSSSSLYSLRNIHALFPPSVGRTERTSIASKASERLYKAPFPSRLSPFSSSSIQQSSIQQSRLSSSLEQLSSEPLQ